jgi:hypothetical protein
MRDEIRTSEKDCVHVEVIGSQHEGVLGTTGMNWAMRHGRGRWGGTEERGKRASSADEE